MFWDIVGTINRSMETTSWGTLVVKEIPTFLPPLDMVATPYNWFSVSEGSVMGCFGEGESTLFSI